MKTLGAFIFVILFTCKIYSQCSDAGICFLNSKNLFYENKSYIGVQYSNSASGDPYNILYNHADITTSYFSLKYNLLKLNFNFDLAENFSFYANVPYLLQTVENYKTQTGVGDISIIMEYRTKLNKMLTANFGAGAKLNTANKVFAYYNGYGTNDLLLGSAFDYNNFNFGIYSQIPLDKYLHSQYDFIRGADISISLGYQNTMGNVNYVLNLQGIKRLSKSVIDYHTSIGLVGKDSIAGSDFFQMNAVGQLTYSFSKSFDADASFALPLLKRVENSDGTKRTYTIQLGINYKFIL